MVRGGHDFCSSLYEVTGRPDADNRDDLLGWWKTRETTLPRLARVAKVVFSIPATSCESERVFSESGNVLSTRRSSTNPERVGDLVLYSHNSKVLTSIIVRMYN